MYLRHKNVHTLCSQFYYDGVGPGLYFDAERKAEIKTSSTTTNYPDIRITMTIDTEWTDESSPQKVHRVEVKWSQGHWPMVQMRLSIWPKLKVAILGPFNNYATSKPERVGALLSPEEQALLKGAGAASLAYALNWLLVPSESNPLTKTESKDFRNWQIGLLPEGFFPNKLPQNLIAFYERLGFALLADTPDRGYYILQMFDPIRGRVRLREFVTMASSVSNIVNTNIKISPDQLHALQNMQVSVTRPAAPVATTATAKVVVSYFDGERREIKTEPAPQADTVVVSAAMTVQSVTHYHQRPPLSSHVCHRIEVNWRRNRSQMVVVGLSIWPQLNVIVLGPFHNLATSKQVTHDALSRDEQALFRGAAAATLAYTLAWLCTRSSDNPLTKAEIIDVRYWQIGLHPNGIFADKQPEELMKYYKRLGFYLIDEHRDAQEIEQAFEPLRGTIPRAQFITMAAPVHNIMENTIIEAGQLAVLQHMTVSKAKPALAATSPRATARL